MNTKEHLYIAYGSNLNLTQMKRRCPTAKAVGITELRNWRLWFRGQNRNAVATIEREQGFKVPVFVWWLQPDDEAALDHYEGFPFLYRKETLRVTVSGERFQAMVYIMDDNSRPYGTPSATYLSTIREGYESLGFDATVLRNAVKDSEEASK